MRTAVAVEFGRIPRTMCYKCFPSSSWDTAAEESWGEWLEIKDDADTKDDVVGEVTAATMDGAAGEVTAAA
ncbi:unnamed protein product [Symbiodinium natans]|uniref:Uncharacterized protein n=1 Tax=Symbiodinium natans TaxID=878477 RepID=A0A812UUH3_9DINO|nr:unnamed protein product [Symbiodinium natans]